MQKLEADAARRQNSREVSGELEEHKDKVKDVQPDLLANALKLDEALDKVLDAAENIISILGKYKGKVQKVADVAGVNIDLVDGYINSTKKEQAAAKGLEAQVQSAMKKSKKKDKKSNLDSEIDSLKVKVGKIAQELRNISNAVINKTKTYSEKIAEKYTDKAMGQLHEGAERSYPTSAEEKQGAGDVDRVYIVEENGKLIVVEVKGGKSTKGNRKVKHDDELKGTRVEQGSIEYLLDVAREMVKSSDNEINKLDDLLDSNEISESEYNRSEKALAEKKRMGNKIIDEISAKNIDYLLSRQDFTKDGKLSTQSITRFKLRWERVN